MSFIVQDLMFHGVGSLVYQLFHDAVDGVTDGVRELFAESMFQRVGGAVSDTMCDAFAHHGDARSDDGVSCAVFGALGGVTRASRRR